MNFAEYFTCAIKYEFVDGKEAIFYGNRHTDCENQYAEIAVIVPREERKKIVGKRIGFADEFGRFLSYAEARKELNGECLRRKCHDGGEKVVLSASRIEIRNGIMKNLVWIQHPIFGLTEKTMSAMDFVLVEEDTSRDALKKNGIFRDDFSENASMEDVFSKKLSVNGKYWRCIEKGYVTNFGRFVDLEEAQKMARNEIKFKIDSLKENN